MPVTLADIAALLSHEGLLARTRNIDGQAGALEITGADCDSRFAEPGHLFVAKGVAFREEYLVSALERGAVAYLCDEGRADALVALVPDAPALVVHDVRRAMAIVSPVAWGHPDRDLTVVGLTGTKGKSTTCYMLRAILDGDERGSHAATMGSIETYDGIESFPSINTTPEAPDLWRHVAHARAAGLSHLVMEVSSQALKYDRVVGLGLDVACFLNLGRDHISPIEHPSFEDYFASKLRIFDQARVAVVHLGCDRFDEVLAAAQRCERVLTCGIERPEADVWASDVQPQGAGMQFVAHTPTWEGPIALSLGGTFNVENALVALAVAEVLGIGCDQVAHGLAHVYVPGRMEVIESADGKVVGIVDFAHNQMAFSKFFPAVRAQYPGRPIVSVFGAVGGKAVERREELPVEAARWSERLIYTEDDAGEESVADICAAMERATPADVPCETVLDRADAVRRAIDIAYEMDGQVVVCLLCRGTEPTQHRGTRFVPVKLDAELLEEALAAHASTMDATLI